MLAMAGGEEMSGCSEPGTVPQKVSQETLGRKNATSGPNEVNPNSGGVQMQPQERNFWHCSKQLSKGARSSFEEARSDPSVARSQLQRVSCHMRVDVLAPTKVQIRNPRM